MKKKKTIGILGGMGPAASATLYSRIIEHAQLEYKATQDIDYPPMVIYSLPLDGFDETGIVDEILIKDQLIQGVKVLENAGCETIAIACNTVHVFHEQMQQAVSIPILHIVHETAKKILKRNFKKVGILASEYTNKLGLYSSILSDYKIEFILPNSIQQKAINEVIKNVMGGRQSLADIESLNLIIKNYKLQGIDAIVLGCTEIPLAFNQNNTDIPVLDSLSIIGKSALEFSLRED